MQLREKLDAETVNLIGEEFVMEGLLLSDPTTSGSMITDEEELNSSHESVITSQTIASWKEATQKLVNTILEVTHQIIYVLKFFYWTFSSIKVKTVRPYNSIIN